MIHDIMLLFSTCLPKQVNFIHLSKPQPKKACCQLSNGDAFHRSITPSPSRKHALCLHTATHAYTKAFRRKNIDPCVSLQKRAHPMKKQSTTSIPHEPCHNSVTSRLTFTFHPQLEIRDTEREHCAGVLLRNARQPMCSRLL